MRHTTLCSCSMDKSWTIFENDNNLHSCTLCLCDAGSYFFTLQCKIPTMTLRWQNGSKLDLSLSVVRSLAAGCHSSAVWPPRDTSVQIPSGLSVSQKRKWRLSDGSLRRCWGLLWPRAGVSSPLLLRDTASRQVTLPRHVESLWIFNVVYFHNNFWVFTDSDLAELALAVLALAAAS